jgi:hypothetical protein
LFIHQKAASFQVLGDIASLRQGIASIAMNAGSVDNVLQAVAGLTQQLVPGVSGLPLIVRLRVRLIDSGVIEQGNNSTLASLSALKSYSPSLRTQQAVVLASTWALASEPHFTSKLTAASVSLLSSWQVWPLSRSVQNVIVSLISCHNIPCSRAVICAQQHFSSCCPASIGRSFKLH